VTSVGDGHLALAWTTPASGIPTSGYLLSYAPAGGSWRTISLGTRASYTLTGLRNGTKYYVYLYAVSSGGKSPAATTSGVPGRRPNAVPTPAVSNGNQVVTLRWAAPYNGGYPISKYVVQIATSGVWRNLVILPGTARSQTVRNLVNGRSYYFRIAAANHFGQGPWSPTVLGRPIGPPPPPPPPTGTCDPNYTGCVPIDSDVDCAGGSGNGPSYVQGPVYVIGSDIYDLDGYDNDGVSCES
jgi:Fibronectin type III domain